MAFPFLAVEAFLKPFLVLEAFLMGLEAFLMGLEAFLMDLEASCLAVHPYLAVEACLMKLTVEGNLALEAYQKDWEAFH